MNIGGVEVGSGFPCRFIAEISGNHNGDFRRAKRLIAAAAAAGADFVKFQCYLPDELLILRGDGPAPEPWGAAGWTMRALYEKAQTPFAWFPDLFAYARRIGIPAFSSVFGPESLALLESLDCPAYKIARLDNFHADLIASAKATGKPVIVSAYHRDELDSGVSYLYCPPGYPQEPQACTPGLWEVYTGFSFHGTDPLIPAMAGVSGARLIEAHIQLGAESSELESNVSLTAADFAVMVDTVRNTRAVLG